MTSSRLREYERLLRRLRADHRLWTGERVGNLIDKVKAHCMPDWDRRAAVLKAEADQRFLFRTS